MKKLAFLTTALVSLAGVAAAADLPMRSVAPAPYAAPLPAFTWSGFYVGVNAGAAFAGKGGCPIGNTVAGGVATPIAGFSPACNGGSNTNFVGGGEAGFNWQTGALVLGLEGDIDWMGRQGGNGYDFTRFGAPATTVGAGPVQLNGDTTSVVTTATTNRVDAFRGGQSSNMLSTVRGRIGFAWDRTLFFATGGLALRGSTGNGSVTESAITTITSTTIDTGPVAPGAVIAGPTNTTATTRTVFTRSGNTHNVGWALGAGVEYALSTNVSAKVEYLHAQFDKDRGLYASAAAPGTVFVDNRKNSVDVVRVGLNWRFGGSGLGGGSRY